MKRKIISMVLAVAMLASIATGCGKKNTESSTGDTLSTEQAQVDVVEEGKVLNIYCWNEEFKSRVKDHYAGYEEVDATHGKIGDVSVVWNITPSDDNAYQNNLDSSLQKQADESKDNKIDLFLIEADYALKYSDTEYTMPIADLGISDNDLADQYKYTKDVVTDSKGILKAVSWQAAPGVLFYNRDVAKEVLGTDDPNMVQEYVSDWDKFVETAAKMKDAGYNMTSSVMDSYRVYSNNVTSKWVVDGKINIDDNIMKWVEDSKVMYDAAETGAHAMWSDDWSKGFYPEGKVFSYFGPAWLINFCMAADVDGSIANKGGWAATEGPQGFYWGGTWICAATGTDNASLIKDIMLQLTTKEDVMTDIVKSNDDFVNNKTVMDTMAQDTSYSSKVLGGQNPLAMYAAGVESIDLSNISNYDSGCNAEFQSAIANYFEGNATLEEALDLFYTAVIEKYPELTR